MYRGPSGVLSAPLPLLAQEDPQNEELSNTVWALAGLRHDPGDAAIAAVAEAALERLLLFKPQEFANLVWGYVCKLSTKLSSSSPACPTEQRA
eukprot:973442-Pyramimonas_sp.AAC.3